MLKLRTTLLIAVSTACVGQTGGCRRPEAPAVPKAPRPHVILISVDTLRADHLGCYGYSRPTSPRLDRLAGDAVRFQNTFAQASWTLPSHMSIMTSQYPHVHGVEEGEDSLPDAATTLAEVLSKAGYQTAAMISWVWLGETFGFAQGFDRFDELLPPARLIDSESSASFKAEEVTNRAIRLLEQDRSKPLFLFLHYFDPHINYEAPEPYYRMFDKEYDGGADGSFGWINQYIKGVHHQPATISPRDLQYVTALYDGEIRYTDAQLGRLFDAIERTLGMDNCLIVFTSDHGEELSEHGSMEGHQWTLYEEVVHVPLIVRMPGGVFAGEVVDAPVELIDIATTILGVLDIPPPPAFQGRDLGGLLNGTPADHASLAFGEIRRFNLKQFVRTPRYKLIHTDDIGTNKRGVPVQPGFELYDLRTDPREQHNLFDPELPIAKMLMRKLDQRKQSTVTGNAPPAADQAELTPEDIKRLRALGYMD